MTVLIFFILLLTHAQGGREDCRNISLLFSIYQEKALQIFKFTESKRVTLLDYSFLLKSIYWPLKFNYEIFVFYAKRLDYLERV